MDINAESLHSYGLIGSGAYHHYKGENQNTDSQRFGAFSAFSALRASPLRESSEEPSNKNADLQVGGKTPQSNADKVMSTENSHSSTKCMKL